MKLQNIFSIYIIAVLISSDIYANQTTRYTYNESGQLLTEDGPRTDISDAVTYTYNEQGRLATITNSLGQVSTFTSYDSRGNLLSTTDSNGVVTEFTYHVRDWLLTSRVKHPTDSTLDAITTYTYDAVGQLTNTLLPNGVSLNYEYDDARRLTAIENNAGERIEYTLDAAGNRTKQIIKNSTGTITYSITSTFDELSRVMTVFGNNGQQTNHRYDVNNNVSQITDGRNNQIQQVYDSLNRVKQIIDPNLGETNITYNRDDQIESITDAKGNTTTYIYDLLGNLTSQISPDTGTTTFAYDSAANLISQTDSRGVITSYAYDALNRIKTIKYPVSTENIAFTYDTLSSSNKGMGRITKISKAGLSISFNYDYLGRITQQANSTSGITKYVKYTYDQANNITKITYPSGRFVDYFYDAQGRINKITTKLGSATQQTVVNNIIYLPFGPATNFTYGNGLSHIQTFDADYRLSTIQVGGVLNRSYGYDPVNNIINIVNALRAPTNQTFNYDSLNRLITASGSYGNLNYTYDAVGNRLSETRNGVIESYIYPTTNNRLQQIARSTGHRNFTYDAAGNPQQYTNDNNSNQTFTFNKTNRLETVSVNNVLATTYTYNPLGQRVMKTLANGTKEIYHYDQAGQLVAVTDGAGTTLREYIYWDNQQIALAVNGTIYYVHNDHMNTPQVVTNQSQQVSWMGDYEPFGKLATNATNSIEIFSRFPGQYFDNETGMYYNYFRDYDPSIGRYIESDPIGLEGGINTYAYVSGNPLKFFDLFGLKEYPDNYPFPLPPDGYYTREMTPTRCGNVPPRPWDASVISNMMESRDSSDPFWLYNQVRNRGPWDYKQQSRKYEDFGNFNYGAVMSAFGVPNSVASRGAGWANQRAANNRANLGKWYGPTPYGDDPADQEQIEKGQAFCECMMSSW